MFYQNTLQKAFYKYHCTSVEKLWALTKLATLLMQSANLQTTQKCFAGSPFTGFATQDKSELYMHEINRQTANISTNNI